MKKIFVVFFLVLIVLMPVFTQNNGFGLRFSNDCWTGAFSYNNDDLLSYTFGLQYQGKDFDVLLDANGFTGRYLDDRFDLLEVLWVQRIPLDIDNFRLEASAGFDLYGFMHIDFFQNALHKMMHIEPVSLPYRKSDISFIPVLGVRAGYGPLYAEADARFGFDYTEEIGIKYSYDILVLRAGYRFMQKSVEDTVLEKYIEQAGGPVLEYSFDRGKVRQSYSVNPLNGNGYGTVVISPFAEIPQSRFEFSVLPKLTLSQFKFSFYSNELQFRNRFFAVSRFGTGAEETTRIDDFMWGAGYSYDIGAGFSVRAIAAYDHHWERIPQGTGYKNTHSDHVGLSVEVVYGFTVFKNYTVKVLGGASYFTGLGFGYEYGLGISL